MRTDRLAASLSVVVVACTALAAPARAQTSAGDFGVATERIAGGVVLGLVGAIDLGLAGEAIEKATHGHGLYDGGATFEAVWGSLHLAGAFVATFVSLAATDGVTRDWAGATAITLAVLGGALLAHAAWSLGDGRPRAPAPTVALAPLPSGVLASLSLAL